MQGDGNQSARADSGAGVKINDVNSSCKITNRRVVCRGNNLLRCVYFNARSIVGKADELRAWIDTWNYDIIAISETWLQEGQDWQLNVPGFRCFRCDRGRGMKGGIASQGKCYSSAQAGQIRGLVYRGHMGGAEKQERYDHINGVVL